MKAWFHLTVFLSMLLVPHLGQAGSPIGLAAATGLSGQRGSSGVRSDSPIKIVERHWRKSEERVFTCKGFERYSHELSVIGLKPAHLGGQIPCAPGDYDGNGHLDFAVWGDLYVRPNEEFETRRFKVLFFSGSQVLKSQQIETPGVDHLFLYKPTDSQEEDEAPVSPYDGLLQIDQDGVAYYFTYDPSVRILQRDPPLGEW